MPRGKKKTKKVPAKKKRSPAKKQTPEMKPMKRQPVGTVTVSHSTAEAMKKDEENLEKMLHGEGTPEIKHEGMEMQLILRPSIVQRVYKLLSDGETPEQIAEMAVEQGLSVLESRFVEKSSGNLVDEDPDVYDPDFEEAHQNWFGRQ
jgi:hypothetical protein